MTTPDEIAHQNAVAILDNLTSGVQSLLKKLGYPADKNSSEARELMRPRYGNVEIKNGTRAENNKQKARSFYNAILYLDVAKAALDENDYLEAMQNSLLAMRDIVTPALIVRKKQRDSGEAGGRAPRERAFSPRRLVEIDDAIKAAEPELSTTKRHKRIGKMADKTPGAIRKALERERKRNLGQKV